jgi:HPt (histidine-containing phosphotransfer) domain-containing protein
MDSEHRGSRPQPGHEEDDFGLAEILPQYFALCRRDLLNLREALARHDFEKIRVLGHNLKGSGGAYGFPDVTDIGASLEASGKTQDAPLAQSAVDRLAGFLTAHASEE